MKKRTPLAVKIKELLRKRRMRQADLARKSGVSAGHISAILKGQKTKHELETVQRIAYGLGVTLSELIDDDPLLLEYAASGELSFDEYVALADSTQQSVRPATWEGWRELHERVRVSQYPGLSEFTRKANLAWRDLAPLVGSMEPRTLPTTPEAWAQWYAWHHTIRQRD